MLEAVFIDLRYFIAFYSIVILLYGGIFTLVLSTLSNGAMNMEEYEGIGLLGYLIMSFRTSMSDF